MKYVWRQYHSSESKYLVFIWHYLDTIICIQNKLEDEKKNHLMNCQYLKEALFISEYFHFCNNKRLY